MTDLTVVYLDTSALVKLYVPESGGERVIGLVGGVGHVASSVIAYPESRGVFARLLQNRLATQAQYDEIVNKFEIDWHDVAKVGVNEAVYRRAGDLMATHPRLRAMDAIHMSSVLEIRREVRIKFLTFDKDLSSVAQVLLPGDELG